MCVASTGNVAGRITQFMLLAHGGWSTQSLGTSKPRRCTLSVDVELVGEVGRDGSKKNNDSAHCLESVALSSSIADHQSLVIQPPCTWNWGKISCNDCTADRLPRITFNGQKATCVMNKWTQVAPDISIHCRPNRAQVKIGKISPVAVVVAFWGGRGFEPKETKVKTCTAGTHGSLHLWMNKDQFGPQCGHCGDFDGDDADDKIFNHQGMSTSKRALCDADVKECQSLFLSPMTPTRYRSTGYIIPEDDNFCGCAPENPCQGKGETRVDVQQACAASYEKVCKAKANPLEEEHKAFFEECMEDVCNGGAAFTDVDVGDEAEGDCSENEAMEDDAVCNHCVDPVASKPAEPKLMKSLVGVACENPGHATFPQCTLSKSGECHGRVRMGYDHRWTAWKTIDGPFPCTNAWFGIDPAPGQAKECECESVG